jgi:hypothetical protein
MLEKVAAMHTSCISSAVAQVANFAISTLYRQCLGHREGLRLKWCVSLYVRFVCRYVSYSASVEWQ